MVRQRLVDRPDAAARFALADGGEIPASSVSAALARYGLARELAFRGNLIIKVVVEMIWLALGASDLRGGIDKLLALVA